MKRQFLVSIHMLVAAGAVPAGLLILASPRTGSALDLESSWLEGSPFNNFLVPGVYLLLAVGLGNIVAGIKQVHRGRSAPIVSFLAGLFLGVFEGVQLLLIPFSALQPICLLLAFAMILLTTQDLLVNGLDRRPGGPSLRFPSL